MSSLLYWGAWLGSFDPLLKTGGPASFWNLFNVTISREEHKAIFSGLRISEMTLSNQSHTATKLLTPSQYSMLDHGRMHCYSKINFFITSHVFNEPQEWIKSSGTITGWFSVIRTQKRHTLNATDEHRNWSIDCIVIAREIASIKKIKLDCLPVFYSGSDESSLAPQFKS